jgi:chromosome segregation protein
VTLFLDNADRTAPSAFNDSDTLEVTRRIERESGSNYKINGKDVRARDVQLLFADASTGARSPAMVRQGQIGELIAGQTHLAPADPGRSRRHLRPAFAPPRSGTAPARAPKTNLERLEDVLGQIESQLDSLKRQARQAGRFRNLSSEIRSAEAALYHLRWIACRDHLVETETAAQLSALVSELETAPALEAAREAQLIAEERLAAGEEAVLAGEDRTGAARSALEAARGPLADAQAQVSRLETEARTLADILSEGHAGDWPAVVDAMSAKPGYETALGAALGEDLDAPVGGDAPMRWSESGGATGVASSDPALPQGATPLSDFVTAPEALARRLAQIGVVDAETALRLKDRLAPGQRLVSRDGALWRWDGFTVSADAPTAAAQRLARKNRLSALQEDIEAAREVLSARQTEFETLTAAVRTASEAEQAARGQLRGLRQAADESRAQVTKLERAHAEAEARRAALEEGVARVEADLAEAREAAEEARMALEELPADDGLATRIDRVRAETAEARATLSRERAAAEGLAREREMRKRRQDALARERASWVQRASGARQQVEVLGERMAAAEEERAELLEAPDDIDIRRRGLLSEVSKAEAARAAADDALAQAEAAQREADAEAQAALTHLSEARERRIRAEERLAAARTRKAEIEARIDEALEVSVEALAGLAGLKEGAPLPDADALERRVDRLKAERERLGGVNLRAEEELGEIETQRGTLISERDDLIEAIKRCAPASPASTRRAASAC